MPNSLATQGFSLLSKAFAANDRTRTAIVDYHVFQDVLSKAGLFLARHEVSKVYRAYDQSRTEQVNYKHFLGELAGPLNARRAAMVDRVFSALAQGQSSVALAELEGKYDGAQHPRVRSGEFTAAEVRAEFFGHFAASASASASSAFSGSSVASAFAQSRGVAPARSVIVTRAAFTQYHEQVSCAVASDDAFAAAAGAVWDILEDPLASPMAVAGLRREVAAVRAGICDKIQQKSKTGGSETDTLRKTFKTYDLADTGRLGEQAFFEALTAFGIRLDKKVRAGSERGKGGGLGEQRVVVM